MGAMLDLRVKKVSGASALRAHGDQNRLPFGSRCVLRGGKVLDFGRSGQEVAPTRN